MDIIGDRTFVEIPGSKLHELPPLMVKADRRIKRLDRVIQAAEEIVSSEELLAEGTLEDWGDILDLEIQRRKMDLAINLVERYQSFLSHWEWGQGIAEWIRQCETTFLYSQELRPLLRPDVWPHAGRSSFVALLRDKGVKHGGIAFEQAVGMRLAFRRPPPIGCFSNQFLFYLNASVANKAYETWASLVPDPVSSLPPERFTFQVELM